MRIRQPLPHLRLSCRSILPSCVSFLVTRPANQHSPYVVVVKGWEPLCKFLGKDVPDVPFPVENQRQERHNITDRMMRDTWIAKQMMFEVKLITFVLAVLVVFVLIYVFT